MHWEMKTLPQEQNRVWVANFRKDHRIELGTEGGGVGCTRQEDSEASRLLIPYYTLPPDVVFLHVHRLPHLQDSTHAQHSSQGSSTQRPCSHHSLFLGLNNIWQPIYVNWRGNLGSQYEHFCVILIFHTGKQDPCQKALRDKQYQTKPGAHLEVIQCWQIAVERRSRAQAPGTHPEHLRQGIPVAVDELSGGTCRTLGTPLMYLSILNIEYGIT